MKTILQYNNKLKNGTYRSETYLGEVPNTPSGSSSSRNDNFDLPSSPRLLEEESGGLTFNRNIKTHQSFRYIGTIPNTPKGISIRKQLRPIFRRLGEIKSNGRCSNRKSLIGKTSKTGFKMTEYSIQTFVPTQYATTLDLYLTFHKSNNDSPKGRNIINSILIHWGLI